MKSYASVGEKYKKYSSLELELVDTETSKVTSFRDKETTMVDCLTEFIESSVGEIKDGDILIVEQDEGEIIGVYSKDEEEKQRRIDVLNSIINK